jgi:hypothetical protein
MDPEVSDELRQHYLECSQLRPAILSLSVAFSAPRYTETIIQHDGSSVAWRPYRPPSLFSDEITSVIDLSIITN